MNQKRFLTLDDRVTRILLSMLALMVPLAVSLAVALTLGCELVLAENIDLANDGSRYAYGENIGWINLKPSFGPGVTVSDTAVSGYAWGENIGWINLNPAYGGVVNDGNGYLSGYAWAENAGWINFAPSNGGVYIDACGDFNGTAWGENIGWVSFRSDGDNYFFVRTSWTSPLDSIAPVTESATPNQGWYNHDVGITLSATDCGSGVKEVHYILDGDNEIITPGTSASFCITTEGEHKLFYYSVDQVGNVEPSNDLILGVDKTSPAITIISPANGETYPKNGVVITDFTVTDNSGAGIAGIKATVADGQTIDTSAAGFFTFTVSSTDKAGNTYSATHTYKIVSSSNIDPVNDGSQYAYGENIGWINFKPSFGPGVTVTDTSVNGYAWGKNTGWINLNPAAGGGVVNDGYGHLSGYIWAENAGWISFSCKNTGCGSVEYGVSIDNDGVFHGMAWGENIGWINFAPNGDGIKTSWRPLPDADGDGNGNGDGNGDGDEVYGG